jgi:hypothetical protein
MSALCQKRTLTAYSITSSASNCIALGTSMPTAPFYRSKRKLIDAIAIEQEPVAARIAPNISKLLRNKPMMSANSARTKIDSMLRLKSAGFAKPHVLSTMIGTMLRPDHARESRE